MDEPTNNIFESAAPEQKLHTLAAKLRISIQQIYLLVKIISTMISVSNSIESERILGEINRITEVADDIKNTLDEVVRSKGFYTPSKDLSSSDILLGLRQQLLDARGKMIRIP